MNAFWSFFVIIITIGIIVASAWLLYWTSKVPPEESQKHDTGHVWDNDLRELNNPLPRWWLWLFYATIVFGVIYLLLFPGLGTFAGLTQWDQIQEYQQEVDANHQQVQPLLAKYAADSIENLAGNSEALAIGQRLFLNHCAGCHGSDARGAPGFPNLTDNDWLYGNSPDTIKQSIAQGRGGVMPPMAAVLGEAGVEPMIAYLQSLSVPDDANHETAKGQFATFCAACHGPEAKGSPAMGAPNLSDNTWLYGGSADKIRQTLSAGRNGKMPAHQDILSAEKIHLLAAYVFSLSRSP